MSTHAPRLSIISLLSSLWRKSNYRINMAQQGVTPLSTLDNASWL